MYSGFLSLNGCDDNILCDSYFAIMRLTDVSCYVFTIVDDKTEYLLAKACLVKTTLHEGFVHICGFQKHSMQCRIV